MPLVIIDVWRYQGGQEIYVLTAAEVSIDKNDIEWCMDVSIMALSWYKGLKTRGCSNEDKSQP